MRIRLLLALFLFPFCAFAQDYFPVKGQVVNTRGEAVEYVQVGVPGLQIGTISSPDGQFEISVPECTLEFFHVSYKPASLSVTGATSDVVIVLEDEELPPAVFVGGNTKAKYLLRPGSKLPGGIVSFSLQEGRPRGRELGSVAVVRKPFLVKDIHLSVHSNHIPGCVSAINIYRIDKAADKTEALERIDRVRKRFVGKKWEEDDSLVTSFSGGMVCCAECKTYAEAISQADKLLYSAKESGRNRICLSM